MVDNSWRPHWDNEKAYPDPEDETVTRKQWAWEFLRRNEQYAKDWRNLPWEHPGTCTAEEFATYMRLCDQYQVYMLHHPSTLVDEVVFSDEYFPVWVSMLGDSSGRDIRITSLPEIAIKFNLEFDIEQQLKLVQLVLNFSQDEYRKQTEIKPRPKLRIRGDNYRRYLQLLDGRSQRVSFRKLGEILCPHVADPKDRAEELMAEAEALSNCKYKILLYEQDKPLSTKKRCYINRPGD